MFKNYLKLAWRNLTRHKFQTLLSIAGLAVALFCFSLFAYFTYSLFITDYWYENHNRVVTICSTNNLMKGGDSESCSMDALEGRLDDVPGIEAVCHLEKTGDFWTLTDGREFQITTLESDTTFGHIFNPTVLAGSLNDAQMSAQSMILTRSFAKKMFGSEADAIDQRIIDHSTAHVVRAVIEDLPPNNSLNNMNNVAGFTFNTASQNDNYYTDYYGVAHPRLKKTYILVEPGYSRKQVKENIDRLGLYSQSYQMNFTVTWPSFLKWKYTGSFLLFFVIITLPGVLILLAALSNFFHLLVSDMMVRQREYALRRCHGAHTMDLWKMVSCYVILMILITGFISMMLIECCSPLFNVNVGTLSFNIDASQMILQNVGHIVVLSLIGLLVAWLAVARFSKRSMQETIKSSTGRRPGRHIGRNILLGYQLTLSVFFITLMAAVFMQKRCNDKVLFPQFSSKEKQNFVIVEPAQKWFFEEGSGATIDKIKSLPGVIDAIVTDFNIQPDYVEGDIALTEQGDTLRTRIQYCTTEALQFLGEPIIQGRYAMAPDEIIVDINFLSKYGLELGSAIYLETTSWDENGIYLRGTNLFTIVGAVDNLIEKILPNEKKGSFSAIYRNDEKEVSYLTGQYDYVWIKCQPGKTRQIVEWNREFWKDNIQRFWYGADSDLKEEDKISRPTNIMTMNELPRSNTTYSIARRMNSFIPYFFLLSGIALMLTLLGIYSAISVDTRFRRKEMAIRKINGAKPKDIAMLFIRLYLVEMTIATLIAVPFAYYLIHMFTANNFRIAFNHGFLFFALVIIAVALFVALTVGFQIWRISRIEPAQVVKSE